MEQGEAYLWKQRAQVAADRITYLEQLLSRAYPMMSNPYPPQLDPHLSEVYAKILREVETVVARVPDAGVDDEDKPVELPCGSCDGDGCPNCAMAAIRACDGVLTMPPYPWTETRLTQAAAAAAEHGCASAVDVESLVAEVRRLRAVLEDIKLRYDDEGKFAARDMWRVAYEALE